jgi:hypothetical protein
VTSNVSLKFDRRALEKVARDAARKAVRQAQPHLDRLHRDHAGKPVSEVEPHVRALFRRLDWKPDHPREITDYAETIARGDRIVLQVGKVKL